MGRLDAGSDLCPTGVANRVLGGFFCFPQGRGAGAPPARLLPTAGGRIREEWIPRPEGLRTQLPFRAPGEESRYRQGHALSAIKGVQVRRWTPAMKVVPVVASAGLVLAACGGGGGGSGSTAQQAPDAAADAGAWAVESSGAQSGGSTVEKSGDTAAKAPAEKSSKSKAADATAEAPSATSGASKVKVSKADTTRPRPAPATPTPRSSGSSPRRRRPRTRRSPSRRAAPPTSASPRTRSSSARSTCTAWRWATCSSPPQVRGNLATAAAINDRGGVLGRRHDDRRLRRRSR